MSKSNLKASPDTIDILDTLGEVKLHIDILEMASLGIVDLRQQSAMQTVIRHTHERIDALAGLILKAAGKGKMQ